MDLNILLTGSSGFLGIRLSEILSKTNHRITALDISAPKKKYENFEYKVMSINNYLEQNKESLNKFNLIIQKQTDIPLYWKDYILWLHIFNMLRFVILELTTTILIETFELNTY